jgi:hypothetical protein
LGPKIGLYYVAFLDQWVGWSAYVRPQRGTRVVPSAAGSPQFKLSQPHLIQCIINFLKLADTRLHDTPAESGKPLTRDTDGQPQTYNWSYRCLLGMLNYLCGTRPDIFYAVHQCSRFCNEPKLSHEKAAKRIVRYLKRTSKEGLILRPDSSHGIQCFVDADFADGWSREDCDEPSSVPLQDFI